MIALLTLIIGLIASVALAVLQWLFGFVTGFHYGRAKGRQEMLGQRDKMEALANKQLERFLTERGLRQASEGMLERLKYEFQKEQERSTWGPLDPNYRGRKRRAKLDPEEWPDVIGDTTDDDDVV